MKFIMKMLTKLVFMILELENDIHPDYVELTCRGNYKEKIIS